eukprot:471258_1
MSVTISQTFGNSKALNCPKCDSVHLHQRTVTVFIRDKEDGDGTKTTVKEDGVLTERVSSTEIPKRRDCLKIAFHCEDCGDIGNLMIIQHKGSTYLQRELNERDNDGIEMQRGK